MGGKPSIPKRSGWVGKPETLKEVGGWENLKLQKEWVGGNPSIPKRSGWVGNLEYLKGVGGKP